MRRLLLPLLLAGCALPPAFAQHRHESPLPPMANTTHVPRLAEEAAPARSIRKSVFGMAMTLLIADLEAQQRQAAPAAGGAALAPLADAVTQAPTATDTVIDAAAAHRAHMALQDDDEL